MAKYNVKFSCGHEGILNLIGPRKTREWKIKQAEETGLCPDCYAKYTQEKREREAKEAEQQAKEMELPKLQGSEKQVAWANKLRNNIIYKIQKYIEDTEVFYYMLKMKDIKKNERKEIISKLPLVLDRVMREPSARFFIDSRNWIEKTIIDIARSIKEETEEAEETEIISEDTISPKVVEHEGIVEIATIDNTIVAKCDKNEVARKIFKQLKLNFNGRWERKIKETNGSTEDRMAELGNKLLNAGFRVCIHDKNIRDKAINADYECECTKWIKTKEEKLIISWEGYNNSLFQKAKSLPGAYWKDGRMLIGVCHYREVQDFAELLGFKFTTAAFKLIENYKEQILNISDVEVANSKKHIDKDGLEEILNSSKEVLEDLREED